MTTPPKGLQDKTLKFIQIYFREMDEEGKFNTTFKNNCIFEKGDDPNPKFDCYEYFQEFLNSGIKDRAGLTRCLTGLKTKGFLEGTGKDGYTLTDKEITSKSISSSSAKTQNVIVDYSTIKVVDDEEQIKRYQDKILILEDRLKKNKDKLNLYLNSHKSLNSSKQTTK